MRASILLTSTTVYSSALPPELAMVREACVIPLPSSLFFSSKFNIPIYQFQNELRDPRQQIGTENAYNLLAIICLQEKVGPNLPNSYLTETCVLHGPIIYISQSIES